MNAISLYKSFKTFLCLGLIIVMFSFSNTFAWRGGSGHGGGGHWGGGYHGHYWGGYHGWGWYGYPTVVVQDPYYYYRAPYPVYTDGYVVAPTVTAQAAPAAQPAVAPATQPATQSVATPKPKSINDTAVISIGAQESIGDSVTLYVPNSKGRFTAVTLIKRAKGYSGPQGEFYPNNPTIAQLRAIYGN
jgi:hypothetical protein